MSRVRKIGARAAVLLAQPTASFIFLSLVFGAAAIAVTPPLRGPDENAHFLRAFGIARGEIVPSRADERGRKGLELPPRIASDFAFFEAARERAGAPGFSYRAVRDEFHAQPARPVPAAEGPGVFTPYGGSEGYAPVPYLPYVVAGLAARLLSLDFLPTLYLMRAAGLLAWTALAAHAVALAPRLAWAFVAIAMLPSALCGRALVNADGAVLGTTLVVLVLCWRAGLGLGRSGTGGAAGARSVWMALCALTKPPQVAFLLLEAMAWRTADLKRHWHTAALVVLPGLLLAPLWVLAASADIGAWRVYEGTGIPPEQFSPLWKLRFMLAHPGHFPRLAFTSFDFSGELWAQLIGVLGWLDTRLQPWVYAVLSLLLIVVCCDPPVTEDSARRRHIALAAAATAIAYTAAVFVIFYLTYTPVDSERVLGLQGRYFLVVLPLVAIVLSGWLPALPGRVLAWAAISGGVLGGLAMIEAVIRTDWAGAAPPS